MALIKISPIFLLAGLMIYGMELLIAAPIAFFYAVIIATIVEKYKFEEAMDKGIEAVKEMIMVFFVLMFAYAVAEAFMATGVGASVILIALKLGVTGKTVATVGFVVTCVLSIATGSSWSTFAACAPIFLWLAHIVNGPIVLVIASIAGGSCFGDNIGLISDTTVVSSGLQGVKITDRVRHQGVWSGLLLVISAIIIFIVSSSMGLPSVQGNANEAIAAIPTDVISSLSQERPAAVALLNQVESGVPYYMVIPMIAVIVLAFMAKPTLICLGAGIILSCVLGLVSGTISNISEFLELVLTGFQDAGSISIAMMLWIGAFGGIMSAMHAFEPISKFFLRISKSVKQLMFYNGVFTLLGNAALADEMAQIVTVGPIIKEMTHENVEASKEDMYKLDLRNATFSDAMGVFGSQLVPWHVYMAFFVTIANTVYPLEQVTAIQVISKNYMAILAVSSMLILTITGLDKYVPFFGLPSEPDVRLKKD